MEEWANDIVSVENERKIFNSDATYNIDEYEN